nr:c-type cytochrome biogenesis protein CcmI [Pseudomonas psychrotolerans]
MLTFWGLAGLLLILAVLILLVPLLRGGRVLADQRAVLNRSLYQERLADARARAARGSWTPRRWRWPKPRRAAACSPTVRLRALRRRATAGAWVSRSPWAARPWPWGSICCSAPGRRCS